MKICYLSSSTIPSRAANSVHVMKMCSAFAALGHELTLIAKQSPLTDEPFAFYGVPRTFELLFIRNNKGIMRKIADRVGTRARVATLKPDLVYARNRKAMLAIGSLGIPFVFEAHLLPPQKKTLAPLFGLPGFRRLVVISQALKTDFIRAFPELDEQQVLVAHDGADAPPTLAQQHIDQRFRAGYVGHLYPGRGIEIITELARRCPWAEFHLVGGTDEDIENLRAQQLGVGNLILHGFVPHAATSAHLTAFDAVLAPYQTQVGVQGGGVDTSRWMSPLKIFEYMAHGKAILASDIPVLKEVLQNDHNALLLPPQNPAPWADALAKLRDAPALGQRLGARALEDFIRYYTWRSRARAVLDGL